METCQWENCTGLKVGKSKYCEVHRKEAYINWREMITQKNTERQEKLASFQGIYDKAHMAGMEAAKACDVVPMIVQEHENMLDDNSPVKKSYFVGDGVCGFAWINIRPGNCSFAKWCVKQGHSRGRAYHGGIDIWCHEFGQSMQRKEAYAYAFAKVLNDNGIKAYCQSRMD